VSPFKYVLNPCVTQGYCVDQPSINIQCGVRTNFLNFTTMAFLLGGPRLEYFITALAGLVPISPSTLMVELRHLSGPLFQSMHTNGWTQGWIDACRHNASLTNPDPENPATADQAFGFNGTGIDEGYPHCATFLRCILFQATDDFPSYWSSAVSMLGFIPTIVALLSNSMCRGYLVFSLDAHSLWLCGVVLFFPSRAHVSLWSPESGSGDPKYRLQLIRVSL
jgi:hypothetical protein